jgi:hypothetical protein
MEKSERRNFGGMIMDPLTVLLSALSLAGTALKPVADQAIKDGYFALKGLIIRKFGSKEPELTQVLDKNEKRPDVYKPAVKATLKQVGADQDQEILDKATELLKRAEATRPGITGGLVGQINAAGGRVIVAGTIHGGVRMGDEVDKSSGDRKHTA